MIYKTIYLIYECEINLINWCMLLTIHVFLFFKCIQVINIVTIKKKKVNLHQYYFTYYY